MANLKDLFLEIKEDEVADDDGVEVYADSVKQALQLASDDLEIDVSMLDYEILEKGTKGFFGIGRLPYRVLIIPSKAGSEEHDITELENKLSKEYSPNINKLNETPVDVDGNFKVHVTKSGIWLKLSYPKGKGNNIDSTAIKNKIYSMRIRDADEALIEETLKSKSSDKIKIGEWKPNPDNDSTFRVEVTEDEMSVYVHFTPPRYSGRHIEMDELLNAMKGAGVVYGINEEQIAGYLATMRYNKPLISATGQKPRNGKNAFLDYKVRIDKSNISFEEDESGKVDFKNLELLENVVVGQLLCVKVPAEEGIAGRTVTNKILPAKSGKDVNMQFGKGTILSEDGSELTAEINGQVVFKQNRIGVEPIFVVNGDVSLETGNIVFLGSVLVSGNVQDNFIVKAAGNIEIKGTVQKAFLEAEGNIVIYQGISGREEAKVESTAGSVYAKFIQSANVVAEKDVIVPEGILHSNIDAGERIYCNGRRARIVGGKIRAGNEINARYIGAEVSTSTVVRVGINPKILQQILDIEKMKEKIEEELAQIKLNLKTLETQKKSAKKLSEDKEKLLEELTSRNEKLSGRLDEINIELEELSEYINMLEHKGKVCAEKSIYPGVDIYIKDQKFMIKDEYNYIKFTLEGDEIRLSEYEPPAVVEGQQRMGVVGKRRR